MLTGQTSANELEMRVALAILTAGPEASYFVAQFLQKNKVVGELSDVRVVTVPGKA